MNQKIYVANLRYDVREEDFRALCERFGRVRQFPKRPDREVSRD